MRNILVGAVALGAVSIAAPAAAISVDGVLDASGYGPAVTVAYNASAPVSNFGTPTGETTGAGYSIRLGGADGFIYGYLKTDGTGSSAGAFANLYFDLDYGTRSGSDLGFEIGAGGVNAFVPASGQKVTNIANTDVFISSDGTTIEFALPAEYFTGPISGLDTYAAALTFPGVGGNVRLNLSQSFGYSVAGGATTYGADRLGLAGVTQASAGAVPEPATWALMVLGFGVAGIGLRRRKGLRAVAA